MSDEESFTRMFQDHYESVLRYAWRRREQPLPWLYATARNLTLNLIRRDKRRDALAVPFGEGPTHQGAEADHAGTVVDRQTALAALNGLSEDDRELVLLMSWEGLDLREAAKVVGCSRPTAAMRLHRVRKRLRRLLDEEPQSVVTRQPSCQGDAV